MKKRPEAPGEGVVSEKTQVCIWATELFYKEWRVWDEDCGKTQAAIPQPSNWTQVPPKKIEFLEFLCLINTLLLLWHLSILQANPTLGVPDNLRTKVFVFFLTLHDFDTKMILWASNRTPHPGSFGDNRWKCKVLIVSRKSFESCEDHNFNRDPHCQPQKLQKLWIP